MKRKTKRRGAKRCEVQVFDDVTLRRVHRCYSKSGARAWGRKYTKRTGRGVFVVSEKSCSS